MIERKKRTGRAIGKANEKRTEKWLESHGWMVHTVSEAHAVQRTIGDKTFYMKGNNQDLFGLWDHVAVRKPCQWIKLDDAGLPDGQLESIIWMSIPLYSGESLPSKMERMPNCIFVQTKSSKQYGKQLEMYKEFPYRWKFLFVWEKQSNGRYGEPFIQLLG